MWGGENAEPCPANIPSILPLRAQGRLSKTDLVGKDEGHPGLVTGVLGDVANELQHGRDPWNTVCGQASLPSRPPIVPGLQQLDPRSTLLTLVPNTHSDELPFILVFPFSFPYGRWKERWLWFGNWVPCPVLLLSDQGDSSTCLSHSGSSFVKQNSR